jgi:DNA-binding HxlR family transcriptional regulator
MAKKIIKNNERRSDCPVACTLDLVGDKWSLLIIRDMMLLGKRTYNEFLNSGEKIATNILKNRLDMLCEKGMITYTGADKRKVYTLTPLGNDLKPVIEAISQFGFRHFKGSKEYARKEWAKTAAKL